MTLSSQIVYLIRLHLLDDTNQIGGIGQIPVMQDKPSVRIVWVLVKMINAVSVEKRSSALDAVNNIFLCSKNSARYAPS
jgi:hypothetical protein